MTGSLSGDLVFTDPYLPPELELQIFEIAALSRPKDIPTFMRISRRIKYWVEPLLYRVIVLSPYDLYRYSGVEDARSFPPVTTADLLDHITTKPPSFFGSSVTHFYIDMDIPTSTLDAILGACLGIDNLVFAPGTYNAHYQGYLGRLRCLRRLATFLRSLFQGPDAFDFTVPLFCNITHLEIWDNYTAIQADICTGLPRCRSPCCARICWQTCAYAQLFFLSGIDRTRHLWKWTTPGSCVSCGTVYFTDWFHGATSGLDFWALADTFIAARRVGKVNASMYCVSQTPTVGIGHESSLPGFPLVYLG
ncbi:hypothetical protein B0H14DRAFT_2816666 [Mycena olivaceomarginata]|nr:hypothetical protein B0H14DRAFT_2816666 [Mycena olivaceomarginata]